MKKITVLAATLLGASSLLASSACFAYAQTGPYLTMLGGVNYTQDNDMTTNNGVTTLRSKFNPGYDLALALGYHYGGLHYEFEGLYVHNTDSKFNYTNAPTMTPASGSGQSSFAKQQAEVGLVNVWYQVQNYSAWQPYFGAGVGLARIKANLGMTGVNYTSRNTAFAYQGLVGMGYVWDSNWTLGVDYRFLGTTKINYVLRSDNSHGHDYLLNHSLNLNFTYRFD